MGRPKLIKVDTVDGRGLGGARKKTITVQRRIPDIMAFRDMPGFAYLLLAANPGVSVPVLCRVLEAVGPHQDHPETWMRKRRQLFSVPEMPKGADKRAVAFVEANMKLPAWKIRAELKRKGIKTSAGQVHRIWMAISYLNAME